MERVGGPESGNLGGRGIWAELDKAFVSASDVNTEMTILSSLSAWSAKEEVNRARGADRFSSQGLETLHGGGPL